MKTTTIKRFGKEVEVPILDMDNLKDIFLYIYHFMIEQNHKSTLQVSEFNRRCKYRGDNNSCCAIGCIIDDSIAEDFDLRETENTAVCIVAQLFGENSPHYHPLADLLKELQNIHDETYYTGENFAQHFDRKCRESINLFQYMEGLPVPQ